MKSILFATANKNKAEEISLLLKRTYSLLTLEDIDLKEDIPETSDTIEGNAMQKADYITEHFGLDCFADDTGLEIEALNGEPGVRSARYAGKQRNDIHNIELVLNKLNGHKNRKARFKTVIALNKNGKQHLFEGIVNGVIRLKRVGTNGFGYDPIFEPENCGRTFGEMTLEEKNQLSHRTRAFTKMITFLKNNN